MQAVRRIDKRISEIAREMKFYSLLTPLNREEEMKKFFESAERGKNYDPVFSYRERELSGWKKELMDIKKTLNGDDPLQKIFLSKADFMLSQISLLEGGDEDFAAAAAGLYGMPGEECVKAAKDILDKSRTDNYVFPEETVSPVEMASILNAELEKDGIDWKCALSGKIIPKITVSGEDSTIYISSRINYTPGEVERLKVHEIKVHIYRGANGGMQPFRIFAEGLAGYDQTEEGLAIIAEERTGCLEKDTRQMKLYAGRALCDDLCVKGSFSNAFNVLRGFFPDHLAYRLVERGKRGLVDTSRKGALTKGHHYISGWLKLRDHIENGGSLKILYVGKIGLEDAGIAADLLEKGVIRRPRYLPGFAE